MEKNRVNDWKKYLWTIPALGFILVFIGLLTPAAYASSFGVSEYFWMWGFTYRSATGYESVYEFFDSAFEIFNPSIICSSILAIILIALLGVSIRERRSPGTTGGSSITLGIIAIFVIIGYAISMHVGFPIFFKRAYPAEWAYLESLGFEIEFWDTYEPHFGMIGPILGGICAIIGGAISKNSDRIDEKMITKELLKPKLETELQNKPQITTMISKQTNTQSFCANCGAEIDGIYCGSCGTKT